MNYIRHLNGFFYRVANDDSLNPTHISLYMALFQFWNMNRFVNPISISRSEMMKVSKICAKATYHKVMKELHQSGFIRYEPSDNPFKGSAVYLISFETEADQEMNSKRTKRNTSSEQALNGHHAKIETSTEQALVPYINNTNIINNKLAYEQSNEITNSDFDRIEFQKKNDLSGSIRKQRNKTGGRGAAVPLPASVIEVQTFFEEEKSNKLEAQKFFNYFQSNGWKVGGRAPMQDWRAAARNWILNAKKFEPKQQGSKLHTTIEKDYGEPL